MNRCTLAKSGIYYEENRIQVGGLPQHLSTLQSALLDFDYIVPVRRAMSTDEILRDLDQVIADMEISTFELEEIKKTIDLWVTGGD